MSFATQNPATHIELAKYSYAKNEHIEETIAQAYAAWLDLKKSTVLERLEYLKKVQKSISDHLEQGAILITQEMGKPIAESRAEINKCLEAFEYFISQSEGYLAREIIPSHYPKSYLDKESLGPILAIMPWNYPLWQVVRVAVPSLIIGNPLILKHSDITAGVADWIDRVFNLVDENKKFLFNLHFAHKDTELIISDKRVRGVTFTGSVAGGSIVASVSGKYLKKSVLELGGSDAYIALPDCDMQVTSSVMMRARLVNNGQSCVAAKRFYIPRAFKNEFIDLLCSEAKKYPIGDPMFSETVRGPLAHSKFQKQIELQKAELLWSGAKNIYKEDGEFNFSYSPIEIFEVPLDNKYIQSTEFFGPVACVFFYEDIDEMILSVNSSDFGLGAAVFAKDLKRAETVASQIECGMLAINEQLKSGPALPFGGTKKSGYGREMGRSGFLEFANLKTVGIHL